MADLLTRKEVLRRVEQLQDLARRMPETSLACLKCEALYDGTKTGRYRNHCWCDFESDRTDT